MRWIAGRDGVRSVSEGDHRQQTVDQEHDRAEHRCGYMWRITRIRATKPRQQTTVATVVAVESGHRPILLVFVGENFHFRAVFEWMRAPTPRLIMAMPNSRGPNILGRAGSALMSAKDNRIRCDRLIRTG